jgi:hypothetical protein
MDIYNYLDAREDKEKDCAKHAKCSDEVGDSDI